MSNLDQMIMDHMPLVYATARRLSQRTGTPTIEDDLIGEGSLALVQAAERWDPSHGVQFGAFARNRVRGAMLDYLRHIDPLPKGRRRQRKRLAAIIEQLSQHLQRLPSFDEVADYDPVAAAATECGGEVENVTPEMLTTTVDLPNDSIEWIRMMVSWCTDKPARCIVAWHWGLGMSTRMISRHLSVPLDVVQRVLNDALECVRLEVATSDLRYLDRSDLRTKRQSLPSTAAVKPTADKNDSK